uniref:NADH:ubiquinone oxidoreductase core subunit V2 n=1 Tax=Cebus imitator TaxID=2715852 RepID=A0A2K5QIH7_CEBIM
MFFSAASRARAAVLTAQWRGI